MAHSSTLLANVKGGEHIVGQVASVLGMGWSQRGSFITLPANYPLNKQDTAGAKFGDGGSGF